MRTPSRSVEKSLFLSNPKPLGSKGYLTLCLLGGGSTAWSEIHFIDGELGRNCNVRSAILISFMDSRLVSKCIMQVTATLEGGSSLLATETLQLNFTDQQLQPSQVLLQ